MMKKILVIFLFAIISVFVIYKTTNNKKEKVLILGEENIIIDNDDYEIITFLYDKITYKELVNSIKTNDYIIIKDRRIYLNELIYNSNYIILTANKSDCESNGSLSVRKKKDLNELVGLINKITISTIILPNYCNNYSDVKNIIKIDKNNINKVLRNK